MTTFIENLKELEPLHVALSTFVIVMVSVLWYSPPLFGKAWIRHSGIRPGDRRPEETSRNFLIWAVVAFITASLLGIVARHSDHSLPALLTAVGFIWLFVMLEQFSGFLWRREPFALFLLQTFRSLVSLLAGASVYLLWS